MTLINTIRNAVSRMGFDIVQLNKAPRKTLLGMSGFEFRTIIDVGAKKGSLPVKFKFFSSRAAVLL